MLGGLALALLQRLHGRLQLGLLLLATGEIGGLLRQLLLDRPQGVALGCRDRRELGRELVAPRPDARQRLHGAVAAGLGDPDSLLGQRDLLLELGQGPGSVGKGGFAGRQGVLGVARVLGRALAGVECLGKCGVGRGLLGVERGLLGRQRPNGLGDLRHLLAEPGGILPRERELLLEARHFGVGGIELGLPGVQRIAGRKM
ncbi:MAG TPA: hypothetical protein VLU41_05750, partial [Ideonella sp.]|nr:hypothetical protein [Ideonella sp.]